MNGADITIITPSFNQGEFIEDTIRSVLSQEGDFTLEYLIMDGGSKDGTAGIIKKYELALKEGRWPLRCRGIDYRWVSEKDKGQVDAIEKGFARASGRIGSWLNSDDVFTGPGVLDKVAREFSADPSLDIVTGDGLFIDRKGAPIGGHSVASIDFTELLYLDYHILQPATFISRRVYEKERLDSSYNCCFDAEYFIRLIRSGARIKKLGEPLASFRIYPEIKTISNAGQRYKESLRISREHGDSIPFYAVSSLYKYFEIVLNNRRPGPVMRHITGLIRALSYRLVAGKERWEARKGR